MRKLIIRIAITMITCMVGIGISVLFREVETAEPEVTVAEEPKKLIELKPQPSPTQVPTPLPVTKDYDLAIATTGSERAHLIVKFNKRKPTVVALDLGEGLDDQLLTLNVRDSGEYRVLQRYRTSMTLSGEGPHIDLVNWRHYDSPWITLRRVEPKTFRTLATSQMDSLSFPPTTPEEIVKAIRREVGNTWPEMIKLAKECTGASSLPCMVSISSYYFRVQKKTPYGWLEIAQVEVLNPMGC